MNSHHENSKLGLPSVAGRASLSLRKHDPITLDPEIVKKRELEIVIGRRFLGEGLGRVAARLLILLAFEKLCAASVTGTVHPENKPSLKLLAHWRFDYRGRSTLECDRLIYELTAEMFKKGRSGD